MATKQSSEVTVTTDDPPAPSGVDANVKSNDKIKLSWTNNGLDRGQYHVQILRDGDSWVDPSGGPTTVGSNTTNPTYVPNSDKSYASQVGIDSSFKFRVRAEADGSQSDWKYSSTVYTDPLSPRIVDVSRPNSNAVNINSNSVSDISDQIEIERRIDTGSGYGNWEPAVGIRYEVYDTQDYYSNNNHPTTGSEFDAFFDESNSGVRKHTTGVWNDRLEWGRNSGTPPVVPQDDGFAWKFTGSVYLAESGEYGFGVDGDDAVDVFIDGQRVADWYGGHGPADDFGHNGTITLEEGLHSITVRQEEGGGGEALAVGIKRPSESNYSIFDPRQKSDQITFNNLTGNARYQFRLRAVSGQRSKPTISEWVYHDYGNEGNVWLEDNCDANTWDYSAGSPEVHSGNNADAGISGPVVGSGAIICRGWDDVEWDVDAADNSDAPVLVKARVASGSMDYSGEDGVIQWYDGSNWQDLSNRYGPEYNKQGWVEVTKLVPSDWVNGNNNVRFRNPHGGGGDYFFIDEVVVSDLLHEYTSPAAPDNLNLSTTDNGISANWNDVAPFVGSGYVNSKYEINYEDGDSNVTKRHNVGTSYTETSLRDGEKYTIHAHTAIRQPRNGQRNTQFFLSTGSNSTIVSPFQKPTNISLTYVDDDQLGVSWDDTANYGDYRIRIERDGTWTDPNNADPGRIVNTGTSSASLYPASDGNYAGNVGVDSYFRATVRHQTEHGSSGYGSADSAYTSIIPPSNASVSRPNATTVEFDWEFKTDISNNLRITSRVDDGSGYGDWSYFANYDDVTPPVTENLDPDKRYQFRFRHYIRDANGNSVFYGNQPYTYTDYGNVGNVVLEQSGDDIGQNIFNPQGSTEYTSMTGSEQDRLNVSGPATGNNVILFKGNVGAYFECPEISSSSPVIYQAKIAVAGLDQNDEVQIGDHFRDNNYGDFQTLNWEYNKQGWVEVSGIIPSEAVSGGFHMAVDADSGQLVALDSIVVADVLHEYTKPSAPTNLSVDTSTTGEISASWTNNASLLNVGGNETNVEYHIKPSGESWSYQYAGNPITSHTWSGVTDGKNYSIEISAEYIQARHGSRSNWFETGDVTATPTTLLPEPNLSVNTTGGTTNLSWTKKDNNSAGDYEILRSTDGGSSYTTVASSLSSNITTYDDSEVSSGGTYDYKLRRSTPDASSSTTFAIGLGDPGLVSSTISSTALSEGNSIEAGQLTSQTPAPSTVETTSADTIADASAVSALDVVENAGGAVATTQTTSPFVAGVSDNSTVAESAVTSGQNSFTALATALSNESLETTGESSHDVVSSTRAGESPTTFETSSTALDGQSSANELTTTAEISYVAGVSGLGSSDEIAHLNAHTSPSLNRLVASGTSDLSTVDRQLTPTIGDKALANEIGELLQTTSLGQLYGDGNAGASISLTKEKTPLVLELVAGVQTEFVEMSVGGLLSMGVGSDGFGFERAVSNHNSDQRFNDNSEILTALNVDAGYAVAGTDTTRAISKPLVSITRSLDLDGRTSSSEYLQSEATGISESDESIPIQEETAILSTGYTTFGTETGISLESSEMAVARSMAEIDAETLGRLKAVTERGSSFDLVDGSDVTTTLDTSANSVLDLLDSSSGSTTLDILAESTKDFDETTASRGEIQSTLNTLLSLSGFASSAEKTLEGVSPVPVLEIDGVSAGVESGLVTSQSPVLVSEEIPLTEAPKIYTGADNSITHGIIRVVRSVDRQRGVQSETNSDVNYEDSGSVNYTNKNQTRGDN